MQSRSQSKMSRRAFSSSIASTVFFAPGIASSQSEETARRNLAGFRMHSWQEHFDSLGMGVIVADTLSRALFQWTAEGDMFIYPTSVPMSDELTQRGYTEVVFKDPEPDWRPTPSMRERDPTLPAYVPPGPDNPLGARSLHLSWQYYRIHGTHDTRKIGRRSSNGCIGLYNEHIIEIYDRTPVGTQVKLI